MSVNFEPGCDFFDSGSGIDAAIQLFDLNGNILIENEVENLTQVTGPAQNVPFDLSSNSDCCNNGYSQTLGIFPINETLFSFIVEIFDNDGGCCDGYQSNSDDNYGIDTIIIDIINEAEGTIDVGSCISFNYELDITPIYEYGRNEYVETVCADFSIEFNDIEYNINNPSGQDTVWGASANGCDSFINVQLDFYAPIGAQINGDPRICFDETDFLILDQEYAAYEWNVGGTEQALEINGPGIYSVTVTDFVGCTAEDLIVVDYYPDFFPNITGPIEFCEGDQATITIDGNFQSYEWSNGETTSEIIVEDGGEYFVTVINDAGCESQNSFTISEVSLDMPLLLADTVFCFDSSTEISLEATYAGYEWSTGETGSSIIVEESGVYFVTVNNALGCENENGIAVLESPEYLERDTSFTCDPQLEGQNSFSIQSPIGCIGRRIETVLLYADIPKYDVSPNITIVSGLSTTLFVELEDPSLAIIDWYGGVDELICTDCSEIVVSPNETTNYYAVIKYHPECELRENIEVKVKSNTNIYIPNIFSPELEANKTFQIYGPDIKSIEVFNIYDRWGSLIMENKGIEAFWDGRKNGLKLANGVYVYYIELTFFDETSTTLVGDVTLIE